MCSGMGTTAQIKLIGGGTDYIECNACVGTGGLPCSACDGSGTRGNFNELGDCENYIMEKLAQAVYGKTINELRAEKQMQTGHAWKVLGFVSFAKFYYDGSVDSELTITMPIEHADKAQILVEVFRDFAQLASANNIDTRGSGMHIAVLPEGCRGVYPAQTRLNTAGADNFKREVTKLLPALYFLGTGGHRSRSMQYRSPRIAHDSKYSAIYTRNYQVFEFRVFETCYDRPEAINDFIQVIAGALKFYADPTLKVKTLGKKFGFPSSTAIANYYGTTEQLRILNATVKYLKPEDKTFKRLKSERGLKFTIKSLATKEKSRLATLRNEYQEMKRQHDQVVSRPFTDREKANIDWYMLEEGYTHETASQVVLNNRSRLMSFSSFLERNLTKQRYNQTVSV